ncbi:TlpA disulfide reductase family protein [Streptomyces sp. SM13]|uniref:TlpA family protein disulfide reductase n=1 Tax=Streptomyces sp. SM13 TaxID=1983803 RepID=UPI000CD5413E
MPEMAGERVDGDGRFSLKALRGRVVVVNAWASWCGPCRAEAPGLSRVHEELQGKGLRVVGVDTDVSVGKARAFEKDLVPSRRTRSSCIRACTTRRADSSFSFRRAW